MRDQQKHTKNDPAEGQAPAATSSVDGKEDHAREQRIAQRAYELFLARGETHGEHENDWYQAVAEFQKDGAKSSAQGSKDGSRKNGAVSRSRN